MDEKLFFLSHSTDDEVFVKKVATLLGENDCWLYQWENKETVFAFDKGIADSRIFIVFWSKSAANSQWVEEEINEGRYRSIREKGYRLITVRLDDEPMPYYLAIRICIRSDIGLDKIVKEINKIKMDLTRKEELFGRTELMEYFQDREPELKKLRELAFSGSYSGIIVLGIDGMGKTSLIRRSIYQIFSRLTPLWVDLRMASSPIRLLSSIAKPLSLSIDENEAGINPERFWSEKLLPEIAFSEKTFIIFDNTPDYGFKESQIMKNLTTKIFEDLIQLNKHDNPNMIIISQRLPNISEVALSKCGRIGLAELDNDYMARALDYHVSRQYTQDYELAKLEKIAEMMNGYPLAIGLVASRISQHGIDIILEDDSFIRKFFVEVARKLFSGTDLSKEEKELLIIMSVSSQSLNSRQLKTIFGGKWTIISKLIDFQIIDLSQNGYNIHNILKIYILEKVSSEEEILRTHKILANIFKNEWKQAPNRSASKANYGSLAYYHSLSSGDSKDTEVIKREYLAETMDAVKELYRRHEYVTALKYSESVRKMIDQFEPTLDHYYALSLYRLRRESDALPVMENLVEKLPLRGDYLNSLGMIQRSLLKLNDAKMSYAKAIATARGRKDKSIAISALADINCDEGKIEEAKRQALEAINLTPYEPTVVGTAARVLSKSGDVDEALAILYEALRKSPDDTHLHSQTGVVLKQMKRYKEAREHLEIASRNPALLHTLTALADVYIQLREIGKADEIIEKIPEKEKDPGYHSIKANIFRFRNNLEMAEKFINKAIYLEPKKAIYYGSLSQIKLDQAKEAIHNGNKDMAFGYLYAAESNVRKGLKIESDNKPLFSIKHSIEDFKTKLGIE